MPVPIHTEAFCCFHTVQQYNLGVYPPIFACIFADVHLGLVRKIKVAQQTKLCEAKGMKRYELTKEQWERIKPLLPPEETGKRGRPRKGNRTMLNGMLWIVRSGAQWRELPAAYGPWQSVYARFSKWRDDGTLEAVFHALSGDADMENLSVDSTCVKVHESANGGKKNSG